LPIVHVLFSPTNVTLSASFTKKRSHHLEGDFHMRRIALVLALAIAAPVLSGCIIVATDKPTTRVVHQAPAEAGQ
jgi:hypothetical protein